MSSSGRRLPGRGSGHGRKGVDEWTADSPETRFPLAGPPPSNPYHGVQPRDTPTSSTPRRNPSTSYIDHRRPTLTCLFCLGHLPPFAPSPPPSLTSTSQVPSSKSGLGREGERGGVVPEMGMGDLSFGKGVRPPRGLQSLWRNRRSQGVGESSPDRIRSYLRGTHSV